MASRSRKPYVTGIAAKQATMTTRSQAWNTFVNEVAETYGTRIVDLFNLLADPRLIGPDKLHPNARVTAQPTSLPHILLNLLGYMLSAKKLTESSRNSKAAVIL